VQDSLHYNALSGLYFNLEHTAKKFYHFFIANKISIPCIL
jgi:hypothetical protein